MQKKICLIVDIGERAMESIAGFDELILNMRNRATGELLSLGLSKSGKLRLDDPPIIEKRYRQDMFSKIIALFPRAIVLSGGDREVLYKVSSQRFLGLFSRVMPLEEERLRPS